MALNELLKKGRTTTLNALEPYYVNYNKLQRITSMYKLEPQTQFKQAHEIQKIPPYRYSQTKQSSDNGEGNR
jgi:hypothetical protein